MMALVNGKQLTKDSRLVDCMAGVYQEQLQTIVWGLKVFDKPTSLSSSEEMVLLRKFTSLQPYMPSSKM